jgi:protein tyrosine/serine phosphatase
MIRLFTLLILLIPACSRPNPSTPISSRPTNWAQPLTYPGLPNLYKISPELYRGAQPLEKGYSQLKILGIKTIVNLRSLHDEGGSIASEGLAYVRIPFEPWENPENPEIIKFLKIATDLTRQPVFIHCQHGSDRTGVMCAVYRIIIQGWSKEEAVQEMKEGGFGFHFLIYESYIDYVERLNVEAIKKAIK